LKKIYKVKYKKVKYRVLYLPTIFLILTNITIYSITFSQDFRYSTQISYGYKNVLTIKNKKKLSNKFVKLKIADFLDIINNEPNNYFLYNLFLEFLLKKNMNSEIKNNLIIYNLDIFEKIKKSYLFLDLRAYIYTIWDEDRDTILKLIDESISVQRDLLEHKIFFKKNMIENYSDYISKVYNPKNYFETEIYFSYLIRIRKYDKIIELIDEKKIKLNRKSFNESFSKFLYLSKEDKNQEKLITLLENNKTSYNYYYLARTYYDKKDYNRAIELLKDMKRVTDDRGSFSILLVYSYNKVKQFTNALDTLLTLPPNILKREYVLYIRTASKLDCEEQIKYLEKIKYIAQRKLLYKNLIKCYKKLKDDENVMRYQLKMEGM